MDYRILSKAIVRSVLILSFLSFGFYVFFLIRSVFLYVAIAAVLALIFSPIVKFLKNKLRIPPKVGILITFVGFKLVVQFFLKLLIPFIIQQGENVSLLNIHSFEQSVENLWRQIANYFSGWGIDILSQVKQLDLFGKIKEIPLAINYILDSVSSFAVGFVAVFFITFFLLKDGNKIKDKIKYFIPQPNQETFKDSFHKIRELLSRYFIGLVIQLTILFCIYLATLLIFKINDAPVIALICCMFNLIPFVGPIIAGVLMCVLTMVSNLSLPFQTHVLPVTGYVMIGFLAAQTLDYLITQPLIFSKSVRSHPLEIFLVILSSGFLFGVLGMMVAVPAYTVIKIIFKSFAPEKFTFNVFKKYL